MAQWINCLLRIWVQIPNIQGKSQAWEQTLLSPVLEEQGQHILGAHWPSSLAKTYTPGSMRNRQSPRNKIESSREIYPMLACARHLHMQVYSACTHFHVHTHTRVCFIIQFRLSKLILTKLTPRYSRPSWNSRQHIVLEKVASSSPHIQTNLKAEASAVEWLFRMLLNSPFPTTRGSVLYSYQPPLFLTVNLNATRPPYYS